MLTVYSKTMCPHCVSAKQILDSRGVSYNEVLVDKDEMARNFILAKGHRTVPQLYLDGELFVEGGYLGLKNMPLDEFNKRMNINVSE
jgi:glutaredoxin